MSSDDDFTKRAAAPSKGLMRELWGFLSHSKKWWLTPIVLALLVIGVLVIVGGTAGGSFIYTLF
jgi:hypothetical protein